uniref:Putative transporter n=1 Tax=Talaromyces marneffei PM1 TaxID=1077442 RepID=A0A093V4F3_TALMA
MAGKSDPPPKYDTFVSSSIESDDERTTFSERENPFQDPEVAEHWRLTYEKSQYECRHVFDPSLTWSEEEEKRLIRKLDWRICLWACVMFFGLQVDRSNLTQAVSGTFLKDLGLNTNDYNWGNITFRVSFLCAELPSQLISKKIGPDRWIPIQITLCFFWATLSVTGIVTSLLAFAIFHLDGVHNWAGWRWLFLIEGVITLSVGLGSFFMMPASAVQTKTWFRSNGWFNDREVSIVVNRVLRDDPSKGDMHNRQAITPTRLWNAITDYHLWPIYIIGFLAYIPQSPPGSYLTLTLRSVGFTIVVGWISRNSNNVGTRSVSAALYNMSVQAGDVAAFFVYREDDKPKYHRGNTNLLIINLIVILRQDLDGNVGRGEDEVYQGYEVAGE